VNFTIGIDQFVDVDQINFLSLLARAFAHLSIFALTFIYVTRIS
jgi:hypothetical protein